MSLLSPRAVLLASAVLVLPLAAPALADGKLAIKVGRIITLSGPDITNGAILIENGRITAIGADLKLPWDAIVIDQPKMVAFPGMVEAHSARGMDRPNENIDVAPFLSVRDSIDPVGFYFEDSLRWGITTINVQQGPNCVIGAQGMVVKPVGITIEDMLIKPDGGLKLSAAPKQGYSPATQQQALRSAFSDLRAYLEETVRDKQQGGDRSKREALFQGRDLEGEKSKGKAMGGNAWKVEGLEAIPRGEIDEKQEPLLALVEGKLAAFFYCARPMDVQRALEIARANGFLARTTLVCNTACWKAIDAIADAGVPVVLEGPLVNLERDPITGKEMETFVPKVFADKKVRFALSSSNTTTESLWFQAATSVGLGLPRDTALKAITIVPAEILGLQKRVGSLEVGKDGNVLLFSGDPLSVTSFVEHVIVEGAHVYDRSKDIRVKALLEGKMPPGTSAAAEPGAKVEPSAAKPHDDTGTVPLDEPAPKKKD
ncbi:MAG TPA: amidohydrolase family protein [Planctomycetota bacterium]|nr:amidohydrolase family protein [Planctomycetota bacterium]